MQASDNHPDDINLMAFADRELPEPEAARIRDHIVGCPACQARLDAWAELFVGIETVQVTRTSPDLRPEIMRSLRGTRVAGNRVRWLLTGELLASIGLLAVLFGALSQLSQILVQQIEPIAMQLMLEISWQTSLFWLEDGLAALWQTASLAWEGIETSQLGFAIPASWWPWLAALAAAWLLGNGLLLDSASFNPFRKGDRRG